MSRSILGVDIGGSKIAMAPVDRAGLCLAPPLLAISRSADFEVFLSNLESMLEQALQQFAEFSPVALAVACAGTVDHVRGVVVTSPNLPLREVKLARHLQDKLGLAVVLENDANAALVAEARIGAAVGQKHVVMLTLGTGVGGAMLIDGVLYRGALGGAGEFGHMVVMAEGLPCRCGGRGCLEMYASGPALARYAAARMRDPERDPGGEILALHEQGRLQGGAVARLARDGHPGAMEAVRQLGYWLGVGLVSVVNILNPDLIVVGGGVGELGEMLLQPAREHVALQAMSPGREHVKVAVAQLGNSAGLVGAALVAWQELGLA